MSEKQRTSEATEPSCYAVTLDVAAFTLYRRDLLACLVRRGAVWVMPSGAIQPDEGLDDAAQRLLSATIGVDDAFLQQLYTFGDPNRDPRQRVISISYFALISSDRLTEAALSDRDGQIAWHSAYDLPPLALDHADILNYALTRLRYKIEYSAVAFQLLPEEFTLRELQDAYMIILNDHKLDKANFRKKIREAKIVESTRRYRETGGRPAELYRFRKDAQLEVKARRFFP